jgi:hypothetical protein
MARLWICAAALVVLLLSAVDASAQANIATEGPNWCAFAKQFLRNRDGSEFKCDTARRCIKLNNYGCIQNHSGTAAAGQLKTPDGKPVTDPQKHIVFEHPKFSLHRAINTLRRYHDNGLRTTLAIAERWAPWCDTLGSKKLNGTWGRTCPDNLPSVSASHSPRCAKPTKGPAAGQCDHCNCPSQMAAFYAKGVADSSDTTIELFDADHRPTALMNRLLPRVFIFEQGLVPSDEFVADGIASYVP